ncbi:MAG TPA: YncE family protein [Candidatus Nitrosocosmicus sp.]|nr:YncE family protein [Candidatus Nitrosocosmicus sp.]
MTRRLVMICFIIPVMTSVLAMPSAYAFMGSIQVGSHPFDLIYNNINGNIYVANFDSNSVSVIDSTTNQVIATIPVEQKPRHIILNTENGNLYVINSGSNSVSVIDPTTNQVIATIPVNDRPTGGVYNPESETILVGNKDNSSAGNTLTIIDAATNEVIDDGEAGYWPWSMVFNPINEDIYVTNRNTESLTVIDGDSNEEEEVIPVGSDPVGIAVNPESQKIYVTHNKGNDAGTVSVLDADTNEIIDVISLGNQTRPLAVTFNPNNNTIYVTDQANKTIFLIDCSTDTLLGNLSTSTDPVGTSFVPETDSLYVTDYYRNSVLVYSNSFVNMSNQDVKSSNVGDQDTDLGNGTNFQVSDSVVVSLSDKTIPAGGYMHLYDTTPYKIQKGHVAAKVPCDINNLTEVVILTGQAPEFNEIQPRMIPMLSEAGELCTYHTDISPSDNYAVTDIAILNNSTDELTFPDASSIIVGVNEISPLGTNS